MRAGLLVLVAVSCGPKTVEEELAARKPRVQAMLDTLDVALRRSVEQQAADMIDVDATAAIPTLPDDLRTHPPLQVLRYGMGHIDDSSAAARCQKLLERAGFPGQVLTLDEVTTTLGPCGSAHYVEVIERDELGDHDEYTHNGDPVGWGHLSKAGSMEVFDVTNQRRIVSVKFRVEEPPPPSITDEQVHLDEDRMYRAADAALAKLFARQHPRG